MWKHFLIIAFEIILLILVGLLTNIASSTFAYGWVVWILIVAVLLILIPTTWFKVQIDSGKEGLGFKSAIPEKIEFSLSKDDLLQTLKLLTVSIINGVLFGSVIAYISILFCKTVNMPFTEPMTWKKRLVDGSRILVDSGFEGWVIFQGIMVMEHEVVGITLIAFGSSFVYKRLSKLSGLVFCLTSTLCFSLVHMWIDSSTPNFFWLTIWGNLFSAFLSLAIVCLLYPFIGNLLEFWKNLLKSSN